MSLERNKNADVQYRRHFLRVQMLGLAGLAAACRPSSTDASGQALGPVYGPAHGIRNQPVLTLAVHPLHNPKLLLQSYQPLVRQLSARIPPYQFEIEASSDYADFERKLKARQPELLLPNPLQTRLAIKRGYRVVAMAGLRDEFRGLLLVKESSDIRSVNDLKGRSVAYPAPTALAATIMPQWLMHTQGLDVMKDVRHSYVGSQESAINSVVKGLSDAAGTWVAPWQLFQRQHPAEAAQLRVLAQTEPLVNNAFMVRADLPTELHQQITEVLLSLPASDPGAAALASAQISMFTVAFDDSYDEVDAFMSLFNHHVRPVTLGWEP